MLEALGSFFKNVPVIGDVIGAVGQARANRENRLMQEKFASQGIRMRVEDAKAAGLHPLFALGANVPGYQPSAQNVFDSQSLGQNISRAATQFSADEREMRAAQLEAIRAGTARDFAQAAAFNSEAARARQEQLASNPVAVSFPVPNPYDRPGWDAWAFGEQTVSRNAPETRMLDPVKANVPYITPGDPIPAFTKFNVPGVGEVLLPGATSASEALESLENPVLQGAVLAANLAHYGPAHRERLKKYLMGRGLYEAYSDPVGTVYRKLQGLARDRAARIQSQR